MSKLYLHPSPRWVAVLVTLAVSSTVTGQIQYTLLPPLIVEARLRDYRGKDSEREERLKKLFIDSGCKPDELSEQVVNSKQPPNVICILPGSSPEEIVVGAHFDHVDAGDGVVDNWSGATLLPDLLFSVGQEPRRYTFVFIGFMGEEKGMMGSQYFAAHLSDEQRKHTRAMINMDTMGLGPTEVWVSHSDPTLVRVLDAVAQRLKLPLRGVNVDKIGSTDSESFARYKIPRITIHTLTQDTLPVLHNSKDRMDKIHLSDYYESYRLLAGYLIALDKLLDANQSAPNQANPTADHTSQ
jgi:Peptidase family M28